jgi:hypothetical protein
MKTVVKEFVSRDRTLKVHIFRRDSGTFGFDQWKFSDEPRERCWIPFGRFSECIAPDAQTAEDEARQRVEWLRVESNAG